MNLSKTQLIFIGIVGFIIIVFALIFVGVIPGLQKNGESPKKIEAKLEFWGVYDNAQPYEKIFSDFNAIYPDVTINYRGFANEEDYEAALLDALASGKGPDIFMVKNTNLPQQINKVVPPLAAKFSLLKLRQLFPRTVELDFTSKEKIYALPLSIDTLALIYNRDSLNQAGVALIPENWEDFKNLIPKIAKVDAAKRIELAGATIGGSLKTIDRATDLLYALMLQTGTKMVSADFTSATFASKEGIEALNFYSQFADAKNTAYTWNDTMPNSLDAISQGITAIIFNYASAIPQIKSRNPFIDLSVAPLPQPKNAAQTLTYPNYWGYAVSSQSKSQSIAWDFVIAMTTKSENAKNYAQATKKPPALLTLINQYLNDPELSVFAKQALIAKSWPQIDSKKIDEIFSQMIETVNTKQLTPQDALKQAQDQVTQLMSKRTF